MGREEMTTNTTATKAVMVMTTKIATRLFNTGMAD